MQDYVLESKDDLTSYLRNLNLNTWNQTLNFVASLPYGRNANRTDFGLVLKEQQGTCSSKHALLKTIADRNQIKDVKLILAIYLMDRNNTPKIGDTLLGFHHSHIPEAHCYLSISGIKSDFTTSNASLSKIEPYIIIEKAIDPVQVNDYKVQYHQKFIKQWIIEQKLKHSFEEVWSLREKCIQQLSS